MSLEELVNSVTHVIGGTPVEQGRFPFQAGILQNGIQFCGGSLIAPNVVLTAASCEHHTASDVVLGCEDISNLSLCEVIPVIDSQIFPDYNFDEFLSGDIQLLLLEFDSVQQPIALASPGFDLNEGQDLTVIGWGPTNPATQEDSAGILLEADVESTSRESCDEKYRNILGFYIFGHPFGTTIVNGYKLCAIGENKSFCGKDSGGPIFMRCDATGEDVQVGVSSFGVGCAYDGIPGIYSTVFHPDVFEFISNFVINQGHSIKTFSNTSEVCVVEGTQPLEDLSDPPTSFPSFNLAAWTCRRSFFAAGDGCHCDCGIPDPDCEFDDLHVLNCQPEEICVEGSCVHDGNGIFAPTSEETITSTPTTASPTTRNNVPPEWICDQSFYGDSICDHNCGAPDPDCKPGAGSAPPEWICAPAFYVDLYCHCNCGAQDPKCEPGAEITSDTVFGCKIGETCAAGICVSTDSPTVSSADISPSADPDIDDSLDESGGSQKSNLFAVILLPVAVVLIVVVYHQYRRNASDVLELDIVKDVF